MPADTAPSAISLEFLRLSPAIRPRMLAAWGITRRARDSWLSKDVRAMIDSGHRNPLEAEPR
jgi:hypothetical protein